MPMFWKAFLVSIWKYLIDHGIGDTLRFYEFIFGNAYPFHECILYTCIRVWWIWVAALLIVPYLCWDNGTLLFLFLMTCWHINALFTHYCTFSMNAWEINYNSFDCFAVIRRQLRILQWEWEQEWQNSYARRFVINILQDKSIDDKLNIFHMWPCHFLLAGRNDWWLWWILSLCSRTCGFGIIKAFPCLWVRRFGIRFSLQFNGFISSGFALTCIAGITFHPPSPHIFGCLILILSCFIIL